MVYRSSCSHSFGTTWASVKADSRIREVKHLEVV